jgi:hypothetical protein
MSEKPSAVPETYYIFRPSIYSEYTITSEPKLPTGVSFLTGHPITAAVKEPLEFEGDCTKLQPPEDFADSVIPLMSSSLVDALRQSGVDNIQSFRAILRNPSTREEWRNYLAVNVIGLLSCADMGKSKFTAIGGFGTGLVEFENLVLDRNRTVGALLFRLGESPKTIVIHGRVMEGVMRRLKLPVEGYVFEEVTVS